ncbi:MAG: recombinase family protein [Dechloromonas sp.]|uniref:Recombinase family protein n=1 Tax=Candidatus Dechloromonas phosphorivorans TaxID=2899244 RepID=A0A935MRB1_9RHOO|nr:recombinase family protein [Candidatus Dechloromonas phosphorivorans]
MISRFPTSCGSYGLGGEANDHTAILEYVEPGASATDDKRPVFQQMITEAMRKPAAFEVIVVHSFSRFFRDMIEFGVYEKRLKRNGVKLISITQQTSDDSAGEMARRLFSLFDEYQSKETAKHTSRAM